MSREAVAALASLSLIIAAPSVAAACVPSSGGLRSFEVRVSVRAGRGSFCDLTLYEGGSCAPDQILGGTGVSCNTDSLVVRAVRDADRCESRRLNPSQNGPTRSPVAMSREAVAALASLLLTVAAPNVAEACTASSGGLRSFDVTVNIAAGDRAICDLTLYDGPTCAPDHALGVSVGGCWSDELVVTDEGTFVAILAPRTARRTWDIVRVFDVDGRSVGLRLADLAATAVLRGTVRVLLTAEGVLFRDRRREVLVPFATLIAASRTD